MRSLKTGLFTFAIAGFFGTAAVIGCGADGSGDVISDPNATEPEDEGSQLPESNPGTSSSGGTKDAGRDARTDARTDSGKDAGPPPPNPGDTCTKLNQIFAKSCQKCGKAEAICEA